MTKYNVGDKVRIIAQVDADCTVNAKIGGKAVILEGFDGEHYRVRYEAIDGGKPRGWISPGSIELLSKKQRITELESKVAELEAKFEALKEALQ